MKRLGVTDYVGEPVASPYTGIMSDDPSHPQKQPYGLQSREAGRPDVVMPPPSRGSAFLEQYLGQSQSMPPSDWDQYRQHLERLRMR